MAAFFYRGRLRKDRWTKMLAQRLRPGDIALVKHADMDQLAAESLIHCGVKAVLNVDLFCRGIFPPIPVKMLLEQGVYLLEQVTPGLFELVGEGETVAIRGEAIYKHNKVIGRGKLVNYARYRELDRDSREVPGRVIDRFVINTLAYAYRERGLITGALELPVLKTRLQRRPVAVVVRGKGYREDLGVIKSTCGEEKPVLIGGMGETPCWNLVLFLTY